MDRRLVAAIAIVFTSAGLLARDLALAVHNGQLDGRTYSFELANTSSKPVVGWTLSVEHRESSGGFAKQRYEPDSCSLPMPPLPPGGVLRCKVDVNRWDTPPNEPEIARITSVLFSDGSAEGNLEELEDTIERHWSTYRECQYWRERVQDLRQQQDLTAALRGLESETHKELPVLPDHDPYSGAALMARLTVGSMISNGLQQIADGRFSAQQVVDSLVKATQLREEIEGLRAKMFPRPKQRLSSATLFQPSTRELRNATPLTVLRFEENSHTLRIVIRNDTNRALSSWGFRATDESVPFSPSTTRGLGSPLIQPGCVDVLQLEPSPAPAFRAVSLEATFAGASAARSR